ncbi:AMP-binding protein [Galactobacter caseinivorans]|uniref:Propionyl-CoA synthetase n=1 Tax=Galactobacter caseinivorans TaxID=2676123 RepID=A0A496PKA1_9MICC|nr:AMP-binding protein [Galactobacter caseinivorans]RKW70934.1 propionyl-CoA synthetase [Galactobacter caseinivorans]
MTNYAEAYRRSEEDPDGFWLDAARALDWDRAPTTGVDATNAPLYRWFGDGRLNLTFNALDRHVAAGRGDQAALIYDSAVLGVQRSYSYSELLDEVATTAGALRDLGVGVGDRVVLYLPMIPAALIGMLACARIGAVHSVVFGGFAPRELASRIDDAAPSAIITATGGVEPSRRIEYLPAVAEALSLAKHSVSHVLVTQRDGFATSLSDVEQMVPGTSWHDTETLRAAAEPAAPVSVESTHPLYILYTSGTTGAPKGVVRDTGGYATALAWSMENIYGVGPGESIFTASDVGWVVGHSYIVYAPLLVGATTVLYEGKPVGTPDAGAFWRLTAQYRARVLFTAPTALRAIRKADPEGLLVRDYDLSGLRALFAAGERLDPDTAKWAAKVLGVPVIDHWWQTETGWPIAANPFGMDPQPVKLGSPTWPVPGYGVEILDAMGQPVAEPGTEGNIALRLPLPPGTLTTLWGNDQRYVDSYLSTFPGYYATGDSGHVDRHGYVFVMGRTDDVINVSGHRLSTGAMEQVVASHPAVAECAVIGVADPLKGQRPSGYVVLKAGAHIQEDALAQELVALVRQEIGPVADFKEVRVVQGLPKTRSGKILRKTMRQMADGEDYAVPSTIEDPAVLDELMGVLRPRA